MQNDILYLILYGAATMLSLTACCYLLMRRSNAIAHDVVSPLRLRRWTATLFACMTLSHLWYMPVFYLTSAEDILLGYTIGGVLDFLTLIPSAIIILLVMLQDRRRPLWPVFALLAPNAVGLAVCGVSHNYDLLPFLYAYYLLAVAALIIYMVRATRQYGRWLRDNYADLEHKEVWQSLVVLAVILLVFCLYVFETEFPANKYITQVNGIILVCFLLWRVETLSDLSSASPIGLAVSTQEPPLIATGDTADSDLPPTIHGRIGPLLQKNCIDTRLYLKHDLTISQLAQAVGTNRFYLSQYFSGQGITYNAYINYLRISHFESLYRKAVAEGRTITARQLASDSGYRSYTTFSAVFKQLKGQTVTAWMRETAK